MDLILILCLVYSNGVCFAARDDEHQPLHEKVLSDLGCGHTCSSRLTSLARSALYDPPKALHKLAQLDQDKHNHQNRGLERWVRRQAWARLLPPLFEFELNYADTVRWTRPKRKNRLHDYRTKYLQHCMKQLQTYSGI